MRETKLSLMLGLTFIALIGVICATGCLIASRNKDKVPWAMSGVEKSAPDNLWEVTAFCSCEKCCGKWADGITASGHKIQKGDRFVAAPTWIPFNTLLAVDGYAGGFPVPVLDRGGTIQNYCLDVYFDSHQAALNWGRCKCKVRFVK